jgi:Ca2+-binding EF-hand superfamily protein
MIQKLIFALAAMILSASVVADDKGRQAADATFKSLDRDADERLSKTEVARDKMLTEHFAVVDADSDGYLTEREYTAHMKDMEAGPKKDY